MSNRPGSPLFLARRSYRFRRLIDAVRLLPVVGLAFWMVPLLWPIPTSLPAVDIAPEAMSTSHAVRYVFGVWLVMITFGFVLWRRTEREIAAEDKG